MIATKKLIYYSTLGCSLTCLVGQPALAGPVYQPPGANLVYGDVSHGGRIQSAASNPAAAAADLDRSGGNGISGTVLSGAAGLEYGNVDNIFEFIDQISAAFEPSEPDTGGGGPGQNPGDKPDGGIDLGDIWDGLDPDLQATVEAVATEVVKQTAILALIREDAYGKAWLAADAPFVLGRAHWGGAWTFGVNWTGSSKAYGISEELEFDRDVARMRLEEWVNQLPAERPTKIALSDQVSATIDVATNSFGLNLNNDSSFYSKSSQTFELNAGYSRLATANAAGSLYLGGELKLYNMRLSRVSVRFGDITDSEELFDAITDGEFNNDTAAGIDIGALWVNENYQIGAQLTNINEPEFKFPEVNLDPYTSQTMINFLMGDQIYKMDRQLKLEGSIFSSTRSWSAHLGLDANPATDPLGDDYQWATVSAGFSTDSWWVPGARIGYRRNLAGTGLSYLGIGLTAFKIVNFDISSALDTVRIDGTELPRGLMGSIGFQIAW